MSKPTKAATKKRVLVPILTGVILGLAITATVVIVKSRGLEESVVMADTKKGSTLASTIPVTPELTKQRLSLSKKIQTMDCAVVDKSVAEDKLEFECKKPTLKKYSRKELIELNN